MTNPNNSNQYDTLRNGLIKAMGIDPANMSQEQADALNEKMAAYAHLKPAAALPGTAEIPSTENKSNTAIAPTVKGRATRKKAATPSTKSDVSVSQFDSEMVEVLRGFAAQGDQMGGLAASIYNETFNRALTSNMSAFISQASIPTSLESATADSFLQDFGF